MCDPRRVPGSLVHSKATKILSEKECRRRYGSLYREKLLSGKVKRVIAPEKGTRKQTSLEVEWFLGGVTNTKAVKIGSIKAGSYSKSNAESNDVPASEMQQASTTLGPGNSPEGGPAGNF